MLILKLQSKDKYFETNEIKDVYMYVCIYMRKEEREERQTDRQKIRSYFIFFFLVKMNIEVLEEHKRKRKLMEEL